MSNPFWDYSFASFQLDEVASSCLGLQDTFGLDVNLLLYAGWLARMDLRLSPEHLAGVGTAIADWREHVVKPLRVLRRQLQDYLPAADVRDAIKALELGAEHQQQDLMFAYFQRAPGLPLARESLRENLVLVAQFCQPQGAGWELGIDRLVTVLPA